MVGKATTLFGIFRPYGICMAVGILLCFLFLYFVMIKKNFNDEAIEKILFIGIFATLFGILMAAIVQGIYNVIAGYSFDLTSMTFLGGLIGGVAGFLIVWNIYMFVVSPKANKSQKKLVASVFGNHMNAGLSDALPFIPAGITIAHCLGRLGCSLAGCCYGHESDAWYAIPMYIHSTSEYNGVAVKVIPTQLFECIFLALLSAVMIVLYLKFRFNANFGVYMIAYGVWRFLIEYVRADYRGGVAGALLSPSQIWSLLMVPLGVGYFFLYKYVLKGMMKHPEAQPPVRDAKGNPIPAVQTAEAAPAQPQRDENGFFVVEERMAEETPSGEQQTPQPQDDLQNKDNRQNKEE